MASEAGLKRIVPGKPVIMPGNGTYHAVNTVVGVVGSAQGIVVYGMDLAIAKGIVRNMVGETLPIGDKMAISALGELANVISGHATRDLEMAGHACNLAPPRIVQGTGLRLLPQIMPMLMVPIGTDFGEFRIYLALKQGA